MGAHQRWTSATHQTPRHAELRRPSRPRQRRTGGQALERSANCARGGSRGSSSSQAAPLRRARAGAQQARLGVTVRGAYRRRSELSRTLPGGRDWASGRPDYASRRCSSQPLHFTRGLSQRQRVRETSVASLADSRRGEKQAATRPRGCSAMLSDGGMVSADWSSPSPSMKIKCGLSAGAAGAPRATAASAESRAIIVLGVGRRHDDIVAKNRLRQRDLASARGCSAVCSAG